ncbi:MAG: HPr family phosphocarrier protein [Ghiorsea sp.]|nr:HPr family phosphocarrier protein [Ghiorsea sp.]
MVKRQVLIQNKLGLHARASASFVAQASKFSSHISIEYQDYEVNGKSIMGIMMLAAAKGAEITLIAKGADEHEALIALETLINQRFGEDA